PAQRRELSGCELRQSSRCLAILRVQLSNREALLSASGPQPALDLLQALLADPSMKNYRLLPSVHGDLLSRLGRHSEACAEFQRAASLTRNRREQDLLLERARTSEQKSAGSTPPCST